MQIFLLFSFLFYALVFIIALMCSRRTFIINTVVLILFFAELWREFHETEGNSFTLAPILVPIVLAEAGFIAGAFTRLIFCYKRGVMGMAGVRTLVFCVCLLFMPAVLVYWRIKQ